MTDALILDLPVLSLFLKFMIASTALLGGVWLLEKIGVINSPDMSEMAWKLAIVASFVALMPVSLLSTNVTIPVSNSAASQYASQTLESTTQPETRQQAVPEAPAPLDPANPITLKREKTSATAGDKASPVPGPNVTTETLIVPTLADTTAQSPVPSQPGILLIGSWGVLAALALAALMISYVRAVKSLGNRTRVPAEHHANQTLRALCEQVDIRHVPFLTRSGDINSPVCLPRREICLPDWAFEDMDRKALDSLIAHELAHMLRRDPVMMIVTQTLSRIFFFQPLFVLARKRLEDNAELAADQWAATNLSTAKAVASALYTCAKKITEKRQIQWGLAMAGDQSILKQRVERLLKADASAFTAGGRLQRGGIAAALLVAVVSLPSVEFATAMTAGQPEERPRIAAEHPHDVDVDTDEIQETVERAIKAAQVDIERAVETATRVQAQTAKARAKAREARRKAREKLKSKRKNMGNSYSLVTDDDGWRSGNMQIVDKGIAIKVSYDGDFGLADDERSIQSLEEDGRLNIRTEKDDERRRYRLENDGDGLEATYWVNGDKQSFDMAGEKWLADTLQILLKNSAIDMDGRVERALKKGGVKNALKKMGELESGYATRMFAFHLVDQAKLKSGDVKNLMKNLTSVESDYEVRLTVGKLLEEGLITKDTLSAALDLSKKVESDYELRLMLTPMIEEFALDDKNMAKVLDRATTMESDYELRLLLATALDDNRLSKANQKRLINAMSSIESDYELRLVITQFADNANLDEGITSDLLKALGSIESDYEKRLGLNMVVDEGDMNKANWLAAIKIARSIDGDYEKRLALSQIKSDMPRDGAVQKAFDGAAETISGRHERELLTGRKR